MKRRRSAVAAVAALLVIGTGSWAVAQHSMQHQSMMQHQQDMDMQAEMFQMNGMMRTMSEMMQRSEGLSESLDQMRKAHDGQMGKQMMSMQLMTLSLGTMAEQMKTNMEHYNDMIQNGELMHDHAMQEHMRALRENMEGMTDQMGKALDNLESMTKTMRTQDAGGEAP